MPTTSTCTSTSTSTLTPTVKLKALINKRMALEVDGPVDIDVLLLVDVDGFCSCGTPDRSRPKITRSSIFESLNEITALWKVGRPTLHDSGKIEHAPIWQAAKSRTGEKGARMTISVRP